VRKNREKKRVDRGLSESVSQEISDFDMICAGRKKIEKILQGWTVNEIPSTPRSKQNRNFTGLRARKNLEKNRVKIGRS
jgi:hypothetical protein